MQVSNTGPKIWFFLKRSLSLGVENALLLSASRASWADLGCTGSTCLPCASPSTRSSYEQRCLQATFVPQCPAQTTSMSLCWVPLAYKISSRTPLPRLLNSHLPNSHLAVMSSGNPYRTPIWDLTMEDLTAPWEALLTICGHTLIR